MLGIFDSGLGGLTSVKELKLLLPEESFVYFGDTGRTPYGSRSKETIIKYAMQDARFLVSHDVDAILVACGTVSATAMGELRAAFDIPVLGVIEPACREATERSRRGRIGVIGTAGTIASGAYEKELGRAGKDISVVSVACPLFVPLVENGFCDRENRVTRLVAEQYLEPVRKSGCDTLILGCTHYPIIEDIISDMLPGVELVNAGKAAAKAFAGMLAEKGLLRGGVPRTESYYVSDEGTSFERTASLFLGEDLSGKIYKAALFD